MEFKIIDNDKEIICNIVLTFNENGINYIIYQDGTKDENGELVNYASRFNVVEGNYVLQPIEQDQEWELVESKLNNKGAN